jgi:hypothetical protein
LVAISGPGWPMNERKILLITGHGKELKEIQAMSKRKLNGTECLLARAFHDRGLTLEQIRAKLGREDDVSLMAISRALRSMQASWERIQRARSTRDWSQLNGIELMAFVDLEMRQ